MGIQLPLKGGRCLLLLGLNGSLLEFEVDSFGFQLSVEHVGGELARFLDA
jgi:hypothetical protein